MIYIGYVCLLVLVVFLSIKLADYVDLLDKKTSISGAFIGGVMLAAVTSLPELFTSISAVLMVRQPELVMGNILGSDIFNMMILGLYVIIFIKQFKDCKLDKIHLLSLGGLAVMYAFAIYAVYATDHQVMLGWINLVTIFILIIYALIIWKQPKTDDGEKEKTDSSLTVKQIVVRFVICAILLIGTSIAITYVTDIVSDKLGLGKAVAGAILLGVATSLPEVVSTFSLCKKGNFNAGFGNIIGSNVFNFFVLGFADIICSKNIYIADTDTRQLSLFGLISAVCLAIIMLTKAKDSWLKEKKWLYVPVFILALGSIACYLLVFIL